MVAFIAFEDTFRRERSSVYNTAIQRRRKEQERKALRIARDKELGSHGTVVEEVECKEKAEGIEGLEKPEDREIEVAHEGELPSSASSVRSQILETTRAPTPVAVASADVAQTKAELQEIRLSLRDVNPVGPMVLVLRRLNNFAILSASGLIFAFSYCIAYTCSRILSDKYGYDSLKIGLVLLAYGVGKCIRAGGS